MATIYFIQAENGGPILIGCTDSLDNKVYVMQTHSPYKLMVLAKITQVSAKYESVIHNKFKSSRLKGEWFEATEELMEMIKSINEGSFSITSLGTNHTYEHPIKTTVYPHKLDDWQRQVAIGTILGGSSLVKPPLGLNYHLSMRDSNLKWLQYKIEEMAGWFRGNIVQDDKTYRVASVCSPVFTELHQSLYDCNKRKISMDILDTMRDIGLAIWFIDGGGMTGRGKKNAYLNSTKFGMDGTKIILDYFNSLDLKCNINNGCNRIKVLFTVEGTEEFLKIVAPQFPPFMIQDESSSGSSQT